MTQFNYDPIRNTAINLVKKFGRPTPCILLRNVATTPADATKPWRGSDPTIKQFKFTGVVTFLGFPKRSDPVMDQDVDIIIPGDLTTTAAEGDSATLCGFPVITDRMQVGADVYSILGIEPIQPGDKVIIFNVRCRAWPLLTSQASTPF